MSAPKWGAFGWGFLWGMPTPPVFDPVVVRRTWKQFEASTEYLKVLGFLSAELSNVHAEITKLDSGTKIGGASGVQLDLIGELVLRPRNGLTDDDYVLAIKASARALISSGTAADIIESLAFLVPDITNVFFIEAPPAAFCVWIPALSIELATLLQDILAPVHAGGVNGCLVTWDADDIFLYDYAGLPVPVLSKFFEYAGVPAVAEPGGKAYAYHF